MRDAPGSVRHERDEPGEYWRRRAGGAATKGVLANAPGEPGIAPLADAAAEQAASGDAPVRLARHAVSADVAHLVRHVWIPRWNLPPGVVIEQGVLEYPSANLVIDATSAAMHGPALGRGFQRLEGTGAAFGALLQPGVAHLLVAGRMSALVGSSIPLGALRLAPDASTAELPDRVRSAVAAGDDAAAVAVFERWLRAQRLELDADADLLRRIVELAETDRGILRVDQLADACGIGARALQRLVHERLGLTPKWLIGRYRMQEAAQRLAASDPPQLAELAAELGFADQAHFSRQFRAVIGETPRRYARAAASVAVGSDRG
ncbi:AraC family transcriptional regulator [Agromyces sp. Leaf222]|uniref:helix-turn-helix domain-containing protein n=1 Tax=Agromyces sp. Leaf222 TaxID=1735688 RepID=UPI001F235C18|nr:helix-turn-helix domain-containing protein [Agromyces sp. Leaf222]